MGESVFFVLVAVTMLVVVLIIKYQVNSNLPGTMSGALKPFIDNALSRLFGSRNH